jgi:hypothetical protein
VVCAGATSAADVWAFDGEQFGPGYAPGAAALQLRSGHWVVRHSFGDFFLTGCNVVSTTDVWALGSTGAGPAIGTWHLHGSTWTHLTSYPAEYLGQASVVSPNNVWASGWDGVEGRPRPATICPSRYRTGRAAGGRPAFRRPGRPGP